jgi:hypothetical protein
MVNVKKKVKVKKEVKKDKKKGIKIKNAVNVSVNIQSGKSEKGSGGRKGGRTKGLGKASFPKSAPKPPSNPNLPPPVSYKSDEDKRKEEETKKKDQEFQLMLMNRPQQQPNFVITGQPTTNRLTNWNDDERNELFDYIVDTARQNGYLQRPVEIANSPNNLFQPTSQQTGNDLLINTPIQPNPAFDFDDSFSMQQTPLPELNITQAQEQLNADVNNILNMVNNPDLIPLTPIQPQQGNTLTQGTPNYELIIDESVPEEVITFPTPQTPAPQTPAPQGTLFPEPPTTSGIVPLNEDDEVGLYVPYINKKGQSVNPKSYLDYVSHAMKYDMVYRTRSFDAELNRYLNDEMTSAEERRFIKETFKNALKSDRARDILDIIGRRK